MLFKTPTLFTGAGVFGSSIFFSVGFLIVAEMLILSTIGFLLDPILILCITFDLADDETVGKPKIYF